jgi:uncharacterized protein with FMN-binding domain
MLDTYEKNSHRKLLATVISLVVIAGFVIFADHAKATVSVATNTATQQSTPATAPSTTTTTTTPVTTSSSSSGFKDGTFSATSSYYVPNSNESIGVSLTLKDGVITNASIQNSQGDRTSAAYQQSFTDSYKSYVIGKKISSLQLGSVGGASDTTQGFDDAVSQIASQAQA